MDKAPRGDDRDETNTGPVLVAIPAMIAGFFGSISMVGWLIWLIGLIALTAGVFGSRRRARWGLYLLCIGIGVLLGTLAFFGLGLLQADGPACGGEGCATR